MSLRKPKDHPPPKSKPIPAMGSPPHDSVSLMSDFQFVNISEPAEMKAAQNRKLVRKSVASNHRRKQVLGRSSASALASPPLSCSATPDESHQCYCQACGTSLPSRRGSYASSFIGKDEPLYPFGVAVDPFSSFPIPSQPYMHVLVDHYLTVYCPTLQPFGKWDGLKSPITTRLFPLAIQNPVYFHALLCISATHYGFSTGQQAFKAVACYHRGEAIKLLSEILKDGKGCATDLVIAAAGSLAHHDVIVGDNEALENHKKGMVAMIRIRGGIETTDLDWCVKFRAYWIDMMGATYTQTNPALPLEGLSSLISQQNPSIPLTETGFACLLDISSPSSAMIQGLQALVVLAADVNSLGSGTPSGAELYSFTGRRAYVEWVLSAVEPSSATEEKTAIKSCCCLSAKIYVNIALRKMGVGYAVVCHLTNQLKQALFLTDLALLWEDKAELLTWVLFQGGAVSTEPGMRKWYVAHLVSCSQHLGLQTWNDASGLLDRFLWVSPELERLCKSLWCEIVVSLSDFEAVE